MSNQIKSAVHVGMYRSNVGVHEYNFLEHLPNVKEKHKKGKLISTVISKYTRYNSLKTTSYLDSLST
jgi:hypothetical protein